MVKQASTAWPQRTKLAGAKCLAIASNHTEKGRLNESETQYDKEARNREIRTIALRRLNNCTIEPLRQLNQYTAEPLRAEPLHCITEPAPHHEI
jgi:hypothetical protein